VSEPSGSTADGAVRAIGRIAPGADLAARVEASADGAGSGVREADWISVTETEMSTPSDLGVIRIVTSLVARLAVMSAAPFRTGSLLMIRQPRSRSRS
jgi:hypothetical protein